MRCSGCGATLDIKPDMEVFACAYCGMNQRVERGGGTITLTAIDKKIDFIHRGVDRTAAELALPRLEREIQQVEVDRQSRLQAAQKDPANANGWAVAMFFVFLALTFFVWWKASVGWAVIPFFLCMAAGGSLHRPEAAKRINEDCDKRAQRLRDQLAANRRLLDSGN